MHRPMWEKGGNFYGLHRSIQGTHHVFFQRLLQSCHTLCRYQRMARQEQTAAKRNILVNTSQKKSSTPPKHIRRIFQSTLRRTPRYDMRSDNHTHQWRACRRPVIFAGEKAGNHLPLLFRALYTAGNRGNVRKLPEYSVASYTSPRGKTFSDVTATPKNVTASASTGKSRKPPTRSENTVTPWRT